MKSIMIEQTGGPEVMQVVNAPMPSPGAGDVLVKLSAIGINLIDTYHRSGLYPLPLPSGLGCEGAGVVEAIGDGVTDFAIGERVGFSMAIGAYAEAIVLPAPALVKIPDAVSDAQAAAVLLKGMTVDYLFNDTFPLKGGEQILFHAAAGGVGLLACQWARHLGVDLIGTASTEKKCDLAVHHGASQCLRSGHPDLPEKLQQVTGNRGFPVIYDSVGQDTYQLSLHALAARGMLVSFGNASGAIAGVNPADLAAAGSVYFTRPTLGTYLAEPGWMQDSAKRIFDLIARGVLQIEINQTYAFKDVAQAHRDLESRATTGCSILLP